MNKLMFGPGVGNLDEEKMKQLSSELKEIYQRYDLRAFVFSGFWESDLSSEGNAFMCNLWHGEQSDRKVIFDCLNKVKDSSRRAATAFKN